MSSVPDEALSDPSHLFWNSFWGKVGKMPLQVSVDLVNTEPETCPQDSYLWLGGTTRDGYGRVVAGVGGEMRAHHIAWSFRTHDPVPSGTAVTHADWCRGGKLCTWPGCMWITFSRSEKSPSLVLSRLVRAYNAEVMRDSVP